MEFHCVGLLQPSSCSGADPAQGKAPRGLGLKFWPKNRAPFGVIIWPFHNVTFLSVSTEKLTVSLSSIVQVVYVFNSENIGGVS